MKEVGSEYLLRFGKSSSCGQVMCKKFWMVLNEPVHVAFHEDMTTWFVLLGTVFLVMDPFKANQGCVVFF